MICLIKSGRSSGEVKKYFSCSLEYLSSGWIMSLNDPSSQWKLNLSSRSTIWSLDKKLCFSFLSNSGTLTSLKMIMPRSPNQPPYFGCKHAPNILAWKIANAHKLFRRWNIQKLGIHFLAMDHHEWYLFFGSNIHLQTHGLQFAQEFSAFWSDEIQNHANNQHLFQRKPINDVSYSGISLQSHASN